ncbi:flagellar motor protein MotB [Hahella sp. SMD15-11]|uniref:Flagellar motor protein MotB n=1 Tax=Thermohahella caldifontis TaxID=3142973 RepID=A0AB39V017_9GAMM
MNEAQPPIIVRRIRKVVGHHGGAWKVAFADFATAMMAFFLVLWLSATASPEQKKAIEGYFRDPVGFTEGGSPSAIDLEGSVTVTVTDNKADIPEEQPPIIMEEETVQDIAAQIEQKKLEALKAEIEARIEADPKLSQFRDQLLLDITDEGLRIQIVDKSKRPMFDSGSAELHPYSENILRELAKVIGRVPNKISISGHTDATPFSGRAGFSNWELSAERANAARRALVEGGLPEDKIARVVGHASSVLFDQNDPYNPINRRISIVVLNRKAAAQIQNAESSHEQQVQDGEAAAQGDQSLEDLQKESGLIIRRKSSQPPPRPEELNW